MVMRRRDPGKLRSTAGQFLRIQRGIVVRRNLFDLLRNFRENGKTEIDGYWGSRRSENRISLLNFWTSNGQSLDLRGRISGLFKPDLDLITQSNGYWNRAKVSEREKRRSYSRRGGYRRDEGG
ncbi:unnamed protein product [Brassica oleracea]